VLGLSIAIFKNIYQKTTSLNYIDGILLRRCICCLNWWLWHTHRHWHKSNI